MKFDVSTVFFARLKYLEQLEWQHRADAVLPHWVRIEYVWYILVFGGM